MKTIIAAFYLLFISTFCFSQKGIELELTPRQWMEDIVFLENQVEKIFPDFNSSPNKDEFLSRIEKLKKQLSINTPYETLFGIQHALNALGDEGCNVVPLQKSLGLKVVPFKTYSFEDGLFVCDASANFKEYIGDKITKINGLELDELFDKLSGYINGDNIHSQKRLFQLYCLMPSLLHACQLGNSTEEIAIEFEGGKTATLEAEDISEYATLNRNLPNDGKFIYSQSDHKGQNYWYENSLGSKTLFVQFKRITDSKEGISFGKFISEVKNEIQVKDIEKVIIDLRYGGGGNGFKLKSFTDFLKEMENINQYGKLFVLTSKATRGTLLELASILSLNTKAIILGQPTGEGPNSVGDIKYVKLPNTGLNVSLAHTFWPTSWKKDKRSAIEPDFPISYSFANHQAEDDPWIDAAMTWMHYPTRNPIPTKLAKKLVGSYKVDGHKLEIEEKNGRVFLSMGRKIKSFFELHSELYLEDEGRLGTDISDVFIIVENAKPVAFDWKGIEIRF